MTRKDADFDLASLLHPARAYGRPPQVLCDPDLTLNEKRAILASWASDACAIEAAPHLRTGPRGSVLFDKIMDALRELDRRAAEAPINPKHRKLVRRHQIFSRCPNIGAPSNGPVLK
jgi:hypothetical protein